MIFIIQSDAVRKMRCFRQPQSFKFLVHQINEFFVAARNIRCKTNRRIGTGRKDCSVKQILDFYRLVILESGPARAVAAGIIINLRRYGKIIFE